MCSSGNSAECSNGNSFGLKKTYEPLIWQYATRGWQCSPR
jgi:hypothetical protein